MATSLREDVRLFREGWRWGKRPLVPANAQDHRPPAEPGEFPTAWARTRPARAARAFIQGYVLRPVVWNETSVSVHGLEVLQGVRPPVMFVSNHASHLDAPLILCSLPKAWRERTAVGAAADYFFDVWWRATSTALVFNAFPIERTGSRRSPGTARKLVDEGWNIVVFPEGTRSRDGWVQRFRHGAARLSMELSLPVVPIVIRGAYSAMPRGVGWPRKGRYPVSIRYGPLLVPGPDEDFRSMSSRISHAIARLWDEDQSTWWESLRREARGRTHMPMGPQGARWRRVWEASRPIARPRQGAWARRR